MPRQPRIDAPGVVHHVVLKGIDGREIFLDESDRDDLLDRLCRVLPESGCECFAWAFLTNHVHAVLRTGSSPLSRVLHRVNSGYATHFNKRHERQGYLFKNRFWSRPARGDDDLRGLVRYVLQNPVRAGVVPAVAALETYPWSACAALLGRRAAMPFESVGSTWRIFDPDPGSARRALRELLGAPVDEGDDRRRARGAGGPVVSAGVASPGLEEIVSVVTTALSVDPGRLVGARWGSGVAAARAAIAYLATRRGGISATRVSQRLGISPAGVRAAAARGRRVVDRLGI